MPKAIVQCAGVSYFETRTIIKPDGEDGKAVIRHEAVSGDVIDISQEDFDRFLSFGAVRAEGDAPPMLNMATPFGVPVADENGEMAYFKGPIMGDPHAQAPVGGLTPEEAAAFEEGLEEDGDIDDFDISAASAEDVQAHIESNNLNASDTVALAGEDPEFAALVLEAEMSRSNPRTSVVDPLEKLADSE